MPTQRWMALLETTTQVGFYLFGLSGCRLRLRMPFVLVTFSCRVRELLTAKLLNFGVSDVLVYISL